MLHRISEIVYSVNPRKVQVCCFSDEMGKLVITRNTFMFGSCMS